MFALSLAVWVFLLGVGILLAVAVSRPETLSATKIAAFLVASISTGLSMGFSAQATRFTWAAWIKQWNFIATAWQVGIAVAFAFPWFMTLTSFWAMGLIVNLGFCWLMFKLAESKWHSFPRKDRNVASAFSRRKEKQSKSVGLNPQHYTEIFHH
ncbi:MAG: hypothetical protein RMK89_10940 [Armatimonadota bacterium]|nr:hypothetical protein [Armatimonadota bacterium]MDW8143965.1 hypothetical protein [Armatimonadota bacterium]